MDISDTSKLKEDADETPLTSCLNKSVIFIKQEPLEEDLSSSDDSWDDESFGEEDQYIDEKPVSAVFKKEFDNDLQLVDPLSSTSEMPISVEIKEDEEPLPSTSGLKESSIFIKQEIIGEESAESNDAEEEHQQDDVFRLKMNQNSIYATPEEVFREMHCKEEESEDEGDTTNLDDSSSETDDDNESKLFDSEKVEINESVDLGEGSNFEFYNDYTAMRTNQSMQSKYSRTSFSNIVLNTPGPKLNAREEMNESTLFSLFVSNNMIEKIVIFTNAEIEKSKKKFSSEQSFLNPTDLLEIKALIGLLYFSAIVKNPNLTPEDMFSPVLGPPIFRSTMAKKRFDFLLANLRFDDKNTRSARRTEDKFAPIRQVWSSFVTNCSKYYTPSEYVTVDETFLSFHGRCPFKTHIPNKPDKYGLKVISVCDARTFYFIAGIPYIGLRRDNDEKYSKEISLSTQYVLRLTESIWDTRRNVTVANRLCSHELAEELGKKNLTLVGTIRKNKQQIPPSMSENGPFISTKFVNQYDKLLLPHSPKKNEDVLLISSMAGEINDATNNPEVITFYNTTKGAVDVMDKLCLAITTNQKSHRWPMRYFFAILDISALNSFVLYKWNRNEPSYSNRARSKFLKELAFSLTKPFMAKRLQCKYLPRELRTIIMKLTNTEAVIHPEFPKARKRRRCDLCNKRKDRKGGQFCKNCHRCICGEHQIPLCSYCYDESD